MPVTVQAEPFNVRPEEAIEFFQKKGYEIAFDHRDVWAEEHAHAFTVAKAMQLDVLADIREHVDKALTDGVSFGEFKKSLRPMLEKKGWWGEKEMVDPVTGEVQIVQTGSARRLKVIYDTNLRTAHAAGKWDRIQATAQTRPWLRYVARKPGPNRRDEHQAQHDVVRRYDDPYWRYWYGPNGWGCKCGVQQLSEAEVKRRGLTVSTDPADLKFVEHVNKRTGERRKVPKGITPGWDYNVGLARRGGPPLPELPVLKPVQTFRDYGRPVASEIPSRLDPLPLGPRAPKGPGKKQWVTERFREVFGTSEQTPSVDVTDPTGVQVPFDELNMPGHIARGVGRERYLAHAKDTVENPFEIWMVPHRLRDGSVVMRRRYIGVYGDANSKDDVLVVVGPDGAFNTYKHDRIDSERQGYLLHTRDER